MRPVFQDRFGYGEGNCAWACVASILEIDLDDLRFPPPTDADLLAWTEQHTSLRYNFVDLGTNFRVVGGFPDAPSVGTGRWTYDLPAEWTPPPTEFWMATINSLGLERPVSDPYYPMPALHAVVMQGRKIAHDPNPAYALPYDPTVVAMSWWV